MMLRGEGSAEFSGTISGESLSPTAQTTAQIQGNGPLSWSPRPRDWQPTFSITNEPLGLMNRTQFEFWVRAQADRIMNGVIVETETDPFSGDVILVLRAPIDLGLLGLPAGVERNWNSRMTLEEIFQVRSWGSEGTFRSIAMEEFREYFRDEIRIAYAWACQMDFPQYFERSNSRPNASFLSAAPITAAQTDTTQTATTQTATTQTATTQTATAPTATAPTIASITGIAAELDRLYMEEGRYITRVGGVDPRNLTNLCSAFNGPDPAWHIQASGTVMRNSVKVGEKELRKAQDPPEAPRQMDLFD